MTEALERETVRKVSIRLLPTLFALYIAAFLDRTNVSLAALQMNRDAGLSSAAYGFGAGVFFIGYGLFEVPSNLVLARVGARVWIARIALTWGILACAMMFVRGEMSFYVLRFLLGAAEAGAFPGIVFFLSEWFPERQRASAMSKFMVSIPLASAIGGPLGGVLLSMNGKLGLAGWQWLFLAEGLPSIVLGVVVFLTLTDRPSEATWLRDDERSWLLAKLEHERAAAVDVETSPARAMFSGVVWWLAILYFLAIAAELGPIFFGPVLLSEALHIDSLHVGYLIGAIGLAGVVGMLLNGAHSDRTGERVMHSVIPMIVMAGGFALTALARNGAMTIAGLAIISFAVNAFLPVFWCVPSMMLGGAAAAGGIAVINSIGNLGGFAAPTIVGWSKSFTGSYVGSMLLLGGFAITAAGMMLLVRRSPHLERRRVES